MNNLNGAWLAYAINYIAAARGSVYVIIFYINAYPYTGAHDYAA